MEGGSRWEDDAGIRRSRSSASSGRRSGFRAKGTGSLRSRKPWEISEQTFHRWRAQYGGMKACDVKRLKELERENTELKRIVADQLLENLALKEISRGNW